VPNVLVELTIVVELSIVADRSLFGGVVNAPESGLWSVAERSRLGVLDVVRECEGRVPGVWVGDPNRRGGKRLSGVA
jgi:hypothetical protein